MKTAIVVSTPGAKFAAVAIKEALDAGIRKVGRLGYDGVELAVRDPALVNTKEILKVVREAGLTVPAIGTGQAYGEEGLSMTHPEKSVRERAAARLAAQVRFAAGFGASVIIGLIRGTIYPGASRQDIIGWMKEGLLACAQKGAETGVGLLVEPLNRYETGLLNRAEEAVALIEELGQPNIKLLLDTFHMNIEERSIPETIRRVGPLLGHIHVADSNRHAPGEGHINFLEIIATLREVGYDGFLSVEALPVPDPDTLASSSIAHLRKLLAE